MQCLKPVDSHFYGNKGFKNMPVPEFFNFQEALSFPAKEDGNSETGRIRDVG